MLQVHATASAIEVRRKPIILIAFVGGSAARPEEGRAAKLNNKGEPERVHEFDVARFW